MTPRTLADLMQPSAVPQPSLLREPARPLKPRIVKLSDGWQCATGHQCRGTGAMPAEAYRAWMVCVSIRGADQLRRLRGRVRWEP